MGNVMMLENVLASQALMETSVRHVPRIFLDFHTAKVFFPKNNTIFSLLSITKIQQTKIAVTKI